MSALEERIAAAHNSPRWADLDEATKARIEAFARSPQAQLFGGDR